MFRLTVWLLTTTTWTRVVAFQTNSFVLQQRRQQKPLIVSLAAAGKGFGTPPSPDPSPKKKKQQQQQPFIPPPAQPQEEEEEEIMELESILDDDENKIDFTSAYPDIEDPKERVAKLLREKYGMKDGTEMEMEDRRRSYQEELQRKTSRAAAAQKEQEDEVDIISLIPPPILKFVDTFLKVGLAVSTTVFIAAGIGITVEAWGVASGQSVLPPKVDEFIVQTVEPNFTYGLLILLSFSISLGLLASAQLGSDSANYRERP